LRNFAKLQLLAKLAGINKLNAATCKLVSEYKLPAGEIATEAININNELAKIIPEILSFSDKAKNIAESVSDLEGVQFGVDLILTMPQAEGT